MENKADESEGKAGGNQEDSGLLQPTNDLDRLMSDAQKAQLYLKQLLAPQSDWASKSQFREKTERGIVGRNGGWEHGLLDWIDAIYDPGIKSRERITTKAEYKYATSGGFARVRDVSRLALQFNTAERLVASLSDLVGTVDVVSFENRFASPTPLGWADVTLLVKVPLSHHGGTAPSSRSTPKGTATLSCYHVAEIQLHLEGFVRAREMVHTHYSELRSLLPSAGVRAEHLDTVMAILQSNFDA